MPPDQKKSSLLIWLALLVTCGLVYWQWSQDNSADTAENIVAVRPVTAAHAAVTGSLRQEPVTAVVPVVQVASPDAFPDTPTYFTRQLPAGKVSQVLFAAHEWLPPPQKPQPPPPPQAPPLPYTYVGSMQDVPDGNTVILLQQKKVLMPKVGGQVNAQWRLDREDAQSVYFTYMPLKQAIVLSKAKTSAAGGQRQPGAEPEDNIPLEQ